MTIFDTDFHSHILPGIDDGSSCLEESLALLKMQASQGVKTVIATPHYRHHEMNIEDFLRRRKAAYDVIMKSGGIPNMPRILLGAEIALERNLYETAGLERLAISGLNALLIELPYVKYRRWMSEEIEEIAYRTRSKIVIAHLDRYVEIFSEDDYNDILSIPNVICQCNVSSFSKRQGKKLVKKLMKEEYPLVFGTDCHNMNTRKPNFDVLSKALKGYTPHIKAVRLLNQ